MVFGERLDDDLARRDFTVNAMALAIGAEGGAEQGAIHDPFGGRGDLAAGILRAVGDPASRFREDALRMLRAVRFAATLGFAGTGSWGEQIIAWWQAHGRDPRRITQRQRQIRFGVVA